MKGKDPPGADFLSLLFSLEANLQLAFQALIKGQKSSKERHLFFSLSLIQARTLLFIQPTKFYPGRQRALASIRDAKIHIGGFL